MAALAAVALAGCSGTSRELVCDVDGDCVRGGETGRCFDPGYCAFGDPECVSGYRWDTTAADELADTCVASGAGPDAGGQNACGGTETLPGDPGDACGACDTGTYACDGTEAVTCQGEATLVELVTPDGSVSASTVFDGDSRYAADKSVDGDLSTSWFSAGPEAGGQPTVYRWDRAAGEVCISEIKLRGNGGHENASFRTGFGFETVTIKVERGGTLAYSQVESMTGTPDPDIDHDTGGVLGDSIVLEFLGHESSDCGGFAELIVEAVR